MTDTPCTEAAPISECSTEELVRRLKDVLDCAIADSGSTEGEFAVGAAEHAAWHRERAETEAVILEAIRRLNVGH